MSTIASTSGTPINIQENTRPMIASLNSLADQGSPMFAGIASRVLEFLNDWVGRQFTTTATSPSASTEIR